MRKLKKISIANYVLSVILVAGIVMGLLCAILLYLFLDLEIETDVREKILASRREILSMIEAKDDGVSLDAKGILEATDIYVMVFYQGHMLENQDLPVDFSALEQKKRIRYQSVQKTIISGKTYYYTDVRYDKDMEHEYFLRCAVCLEDISSDYLMLIGMFVMIFIVFFVIFVGMGLWIRKHIKSSFSKMDKKMELIGTSDSFSERITYDGYFEEMHLLCNADNRMLERMENNISLQKQYISDVSHELRTPISVIMAQAQYGEKLSSDSKTKEVFTSIVRHSQSMRDLIMTLLELSRLDSTDTVKDKEALDLAELTEFVCEDIEENLKKAIHIHYDLKPASVKGNMDQISLAISNLVTNAIKYSSDENKILVQTGEKDKKAFVRIQDYGIGIPKAEQKHIFERFYKVDESRNSSGYGLGLPIAMKVAQIHGGTIHVESEEGNGSVFTLYLGKEG